MKNFKMMTLIGFLFLNSVFAQSFSEFVSGNLVKLHGDIFSLVSLIQGNTKPQEVKELRKKIGLYKIYLDLGIYIYPKKNGVELKEIRDEMDKAYEVYGNFKDLYDTAEYYSDFLQENKLRGKVIAWNQNVSQVTGKWLKFISHPLTRGNTKVKKKELPKFLWARVDFKPEAQDDAAEVLLTLTNLIFEEASAEAKDFLKIKNLKKTSDEEDFHDFRKLVRTSLKLVEQLPILRSSVGEASFVILGEMIDKIGDINDLLVAFHKTDRIELLKQALLDFDSLKSWMKSNNIRYHLEDIL